ncbi:LysR family transcriptional regulator [Paraburkholderia caballeronis]|uniref:LysR family transcriptional regulator n=1 Tax=Paraburkholderia caballeronis TaxID=416943 RepID=UPI00106576A1|nr:LysR family transcriptional regulator [Paraburkholderia caballeronis]TDV11635.1 LysR family transcriptional regulator [Paraburkholderia caballeronis]TDV17358.1 LysR family transcriptional regulator [Paraburkholderia caballeronis]TDV27376.1 LysR family transcriptional regulator [Paraburkholderia caballeronis]
MSEADLNLLIALDALLAEESVAGAARRLGLSASAMSRTLTRLRTATGDPLLVRAGRRMVLTPYAQEIRARTTNAVQEARAVLSPSAAALDLSTLRRTFTIRANDGFIEAFAASLIAAATADAPQVCLRFAPKPEKTSAFLRDGSVDLEIGVLGEMGPEVRVQALFRDRFVGAVRTGHPVELEPEITAERYAALSHVVASRRGRTGGPVDDALAALGLKRKIVAVVPGFRAALVVALASDLVALVPASFIDGEAGRCGQSGSAAIRAFELPVQTARITVSQMWHPRLDADPAHRWLRAIVLAVCRRETSV